MRVEHPASRKLSGSVPEGATQTLDGPLIIAQSRNTAGTTASWLSSNGNEFQTALPQFARPPATDDAKFGVVSCDLQESGEDDPAALIQFHGRPSLFRASQQNLWLCEGGSERRRAGNCQDRIFLRERRQADQRLMPNVIRLLIHAGRDVTKDLLNSEFPAPSLSPPGGTGALPRAESSSKTGTHARNIALMRWHCCL